MGNVLCCSECTDCICCEAVEQFELPPTKTGDLLKQGKYTKHINKRYCIMKDGFLLGAHHGMTLDDVDRVCNLLKTFANRKLNETCSVM